MDGDLYSYTFSCMKTREDKKYFHLSTQTYSGPVHSLIECSRNLILMAFPNNRLLVFGW